MRPQPCRKDCPKRNGECHSICQEYKDWRAERDEFIRHRRDGRISKWYNNESAARALRKKLNAYKRNH